MFEIGGAFGALSAGWASDHLFGAKRGPINVIYGIGIFAALLAYWLVDIRFPLYDSVAIFIIGFINNSEEHQKGDIVQNRI